MMMRKKNDFMKFMQHNHFISTLDFTTKQTSQQNTKHFKFQNSKTPNTSGRDTPLVSH
eukprot:UN13556